MAATYPVQRTLGGAAMAVLRALAGLLGWWLLQCRAVVGRERARVANHHGGDIPIAYRPLPDGVLSTVRAIVADPTTRRDVVYLLVVPLYGLAVGVAVGFATAGTIAMIAEPFLNPPTASTVSRGASTRCWRSWPGATTTPPSQRRSSSAAVRSRSTCTASSPSSG